MQYFTIAHIRLSIHQKIFVKHLVCTQHHARCCGEHRRNGRHSLCPLCSYLEVAASQGGGMTAVSTPYPVSGLTSLCYMSVAPQTFTPSQPHPALGICKTMVGGRKEGARRQMKGLRRNSRIYPTCLPQLEKINETSPSPRDEAQFPCIACRAMAFSQSNT